jgi:hypothetical protein
MRDKNPTSEPVAENTGPSNIIYDAVVDYPEPADFTPEAEVVEEVVAEPAEKPATTAPASAPYSVGGGDFDEVYLSKAIYKNIHSKKALTVHHIQRRLLEWGYPAAYSDKDGFYGDHTKNSVAEFQKAQGIEGDGLMNAETMTALFENDPNVTVILA